MRKVLILILLLVTSHCLIAQQHDFCLKHNYNGMNFRQFTDSLLSSEGIPIFFHDEWVGDITVEQDITNCSLADLLNKTLEKIDCEFIIDPSNNILLTGNTAIFTSLPETFFTNKSTQSMRINNDIRITKEPDRQSLQSGISTTSITIGNPANKVLSSQAIFSGSVKEASGGEPVAGAVVYAENAKIGSVTDNNGYFVMNLPAGQHTITLRCVGMETQTIQLTLNESGNTEIEMHEEITALRGVIVIADKGKNVSGMQIGLDKISIDLVKQIPAMMGEADVLKTAILLPGVQTVGEGAAGFNVRGGSTDQNLILLNSSPVFNSSHFFGFFSAFNPDLIKEFELYKSGIPAEYGGRISSVFEINTKSGNNKNISGSGGISPVTARLMFEGPTVREKGSFIIGVRSTFSDILLNQFKVPELQRSNVSFYDANFIVNQTINKRNDFSVSLYNSKDEFQLSSDTTYSYSNTNGTLEWRHKFSDKMISETKAIFSHYDYNVNSSENKINAFDMNYSIEYLEGRTDFRYFLSNSHSVKFGIGSVWYFLEPGSLLPAGYESLVAPFYLEKENANEISAYISDEYSISEKLSVYGGLRFTLYRYLGPGTVNYYSEGPREPFNLVESVYEEDNTLQSYNGPELRFSVRYKVDRVSSLKISYNRMRQNLHMLSNTTAISPTDIWKLSDNHIMPQVGDQIAMGYYKDFRSNTIETSAEIYYKHIQDIIEYKGGASLILNPLIETDLINGTGHAYGIELMAKKKYGRLNGIISYTYSRTFIRVLGEYPEETINQGRYYPANYDKPNDLTGVISYKFNRRFSISSNITYSTGRPITFPVAKYKFRESEYVHYSDRNEYRVPDYFRCDVALNLEGNLKNKKLAHSSWSFSVYNVSGRNNVYSIFFTSRSGKIQGYKLSIFSEPVPTLTYSFRF